MESKKKAIYVHGLGSGAASTTIDIVRKVFSDYEWTPVEVNEDPVDSVNIINHTIGQLHPALFDERKTKYRVGDRVLFKTSEPGEHFHRYYGEGGPMDPRARRKEEFVGVIRGIYPEGIPQLYSAVTFAPLSSFYCSFVSEKDIKRLATDEDLGRLC